MERSTNNLIDHILTLLRNQPGHLKYKMHVNTLKESFLQEFPDVDLLGLLKIMKHEDLLESNASGVYIVTGKGVSILESGGYAEFVSAQKARELDLEKARVKTVEHLQLQIDLIKRKQDEFNWDRLISIVSALIAALTFVYTFFIK